MPNLKNILIFVAIGAVLVLGYIYFLQPSTEPGNLTTTLPNGTVVPSGATDSNADVNVGQDFLTLLLSVKNIKLDDAIFADTAFLTLRDSSITLVQEGNEGRPNPFAPIGSDETTVIPTTPIPGTPN